MTATMTAIPANVLLDVPGVGLKATPLTLHIDLDPYETREAFRHRILALLEEYYLDHGKISSVVIEELGEGGRFRVALADTELSTRKLYRWTSFLWTPPARKLCPPLSPSSSSTRTATTGTCRTSRRTPRPSDWPSS